MKTEYFMGWRFATIGLYLAIFVAMLDQGTKYFVKNLLVAPPNSLEVTSWLNLVLVTNKGITFGLLNNVYYTPYMPHILTGIAIVIVLFLVNWIMRAASLLIAIGLGLVMGGAIGNIIDRIRYGGVIDFIDMHWRGYHWYAFNIADSAVVCGVILLLLENFIRGKKAR